MAEPRARVIDGKKFMWDGRDHENTKEAEAVREEYEEKGFETRIVNDDGKVHIYTRRVVTDVSV